MYHAMDAIIAATALVHGMTATALAVAAHLAATAFVHGMTVVTRNVADFQSAGVAILNPWEWTE